MPTTALEPIGVEVTGLDLATADDARIDELRALLAEHGVVVVPGQEGLDDDGLAALRRRVGEVRAAPGARGRGALRRPVPRLRDPVVGHPHAPRGPHGHRRGRRRAPAVPPAPGHRAHRAAPRRARARRGDQRDGRRRVADDDRLPLRARDGRGHRLPAHLVAGRRRPLGPRPRPAPRDGGGSGEPARRRRPRPEDPRRARPADRPAAGDARGHRGGAGALAAGPAAAHGGRRPAHRAHQRRQDDQGPGAGARVPRRGPPGGAGRVGAATGSPGTASRGRSTPSTWCRNPARPATSTRCATSWSPRASTSGCRSAARRRAGTTRWPSRCSPSSARCCTPTPRCCASSTTRTASPRPPTRSACPSPRPTG